MTLLIAKGVSKAYATSSAPFYALRKTSLSFPSQGLVAIKGKSGSGKSTLLNLLSGMETPTTGQIFFQGNLLSAKKRPLLGYEGAMVFQHYNLIFGLSALDNVALPLRMRGKGKEKAREAMKHLGIAKLAKRKVDEATIEHFSEVLSTCEFARYAPSSDDQAMDKLYQEASDTIDSLEKAL